jgi:enediyne biosynthesis protein E4
MLLAARWAAAAGVPEGGGAPAPPSAPVIRLDDVTKASGVKFKFETDLQHGRLIATMGGGVAMGDYDGDGFLDLFVTGSVAKWKKPEAGPCGALFRNRGDGTFEDATARSGIRSCGWAMGASWVDLDGTGRLDLVVTGLGRTAIWQNCGDGTFRDVTEARGMSARGFAVGLAAGDVNGDGKPDLYVVNYLDSDVEREMSYHTFQLRLPDDYAGQDGTLWIQKEDGTFSERAAAAGALNHDGKGLGGVFFDYNGDGKPDLYVTNDRTPNVLYRGRGDGTFDDVTLETGAGARDQKVPRAGMGIAVGDIDGDGWPDLLVTNFGGEPNTVYRNVEGALFDEFTDASNVTPGKLPWVEFGTDLVDLDNDGALDLVCTSGHLVPRLFLFIGQLSRSGGRNLYDLGSQSYRQPMKVWRNRGDGRFDDVTEGAGDYGTTKVAGRGLAVGDVDGDGLLDVAVAAISGGHRLFRNRSTGGGAFLEILPVAGADRRTVLGTKVIVTAGGKRQVQEFFLRPSYASGSWVPLHFGLGASRVADRVEVIPPGATAPALVFENVEANRVYTLRDGELTQRREARR